MLYIIPCDLLFFHQIFYCYNYFILFLVATMQSFWLLCNILVCKYTLSEFIHSFTMGFWISAAITVKAITNILIYTSLPLAFEGSKVLPQMEACTPYLKTLKGINSATHDPYSRTHRLYLRNAPHNPRSKGSMPCPKVPCLYDLRGRVNESWIWARMPERWQAPPALTWDKVKLPRQQCKVSPLAFLTWDF